MNAVTLQKFSLLQLYVHVSLQTSIFSSTKVYSGFTLIKYEFHPPLQRVRSESHSNSPFEHLKIETLSHEPCTFFTSRTIAVAISFFAGKFQICRKRAQQLLFNAVALQKIARYMYMFHFKLVHFHPQKFTVVFL